MINKYLITIILTILLIIPFILASDVSITDLDKPDLSNTATIQIKPDIIPNNDISIIQTNQLPSGYSRSHKIHNDDQLVDIDEKEVKNMPTHFTGTIKLTDNGNPTSVWVYKDGRKINSIDFPIILEEDSILVDEIIEDYLRVTAYTPKNNQEFTGPQALIEFAFRVESNLQVSRCTLDFDDGSSHSLSDLIISTPNYIMADDMNYFTLTKPDGVYYYQFSCFTSGHRASSSTLKFIVTSPLIPESPEIIEEPNFNYNGGCLTTYVCSDWSNCDESGKQTRNCEKDRNNCHSPNPKPTESQLCTLPSIEQLSNTPPQEIQQTPQSGLTGITGAFIGVNEFTNGGFTIILIAFIFGLVLLYLAIRHGR